MFRLPFHQPGTFLETSAGIEALPALCPEHSFLRGYCRRGFLLVGLSSERGLLFPAILSLPSSLRGFLPPILPDGFSILLQIFT